MSQSFRDASTCSEVDGTSVRRNRIAGGFPTIQIGWASSLGCPQGFEPRYADPELRNYRE